MPTYVYKFVETGETIEVQQSFSDDSLTEAAHPGTGIVMPVKKVFTPVGVSFKGGGFYKTDSRGKSSSVAAPAAGGSDGGQGAAGAGSESSSATSPSPAAPSSGSVGSGSNGSGSNGSGSNGSGSNGSGSNGAGSSAKPATTPAG